MAYLQGRRLLGITGAIAAIAGTILPSFFIILFIAIFAMKYFSNEKVAAFLKGCGIAVTGQLAFAAFIFGRRHLRNLANAIICLVAFLAVAFFNWHPVLGVMLAGLMGLFLCKPQLPEDLEKEENKNNDFA
jgi:chromate transporter